MTRALIPAVAAMFCLSGCATITNGGRDQHVKVTSNPPGAAVLVDGEPRGVTPTVVQLNRKTEHAVTISNPGYEPAQVTLERHINPWVFGNILVGGLVGVVVDVCTDSTHRLSPNEIDVQLRCASKAPTYRGAEPLSMDLPADSAGHTRHR